jgi:DNA mismatch repair protein MutS2
MNAEPAWDHVADRGTLVALEWPEYLALLAELASTDLGAAAIRSSPPLPSRDDHELRGQQVAEMELLLLEGALVPLEDEPIEPRRGRLQARRDLEGADLVVLARALDAALAARRRIDEDERLVALPRLVATLEPLEPLVQQTRRVLDERGEIRDDASPALLRLREQVRRRRDEVYGVLHEQMAQHRELLADETFPVRDGRVVLVVQSSGRPHLDGLVHGRSGTGRSVYLEPLAAVGANNALRQASDDELAERARLLRELADAWRAAVDGVIEALVILTALDRLQALARFAGRIEGRVADLDPDQWLRLVDARHPLLEPRLEHLREQALGSAGHRGVVVGLDLELDAATRVVAITGANAGGKTVSLKTVGLALLATRAGMPFPLARGSALPWPERIVAAVGDEQDVLQERSTFSGRLERIRAALEVADRGTVVLLDELGSGTDPEEGSALSAAVVESLLARGSRVLVTTHLAALAAHVAALPGSTTAGMDFDPEHGTPRYRLRLGPVAGSQALALARRLGFPRDLLERAESLLGHEAMRLRRTIAEAEALRERLQQELAEVEARTAGVERERQQLAAESERLRATTKEVARDTARRLESFRVQVREHLGVELARLEQELGAGRRRGLVPAAIERLFADAAEVVPSTPVEESPEPLAVGATVRHRSLGWVGKVERCEPGREVEVIAGGMRLRAPAADLVTTKAPAPQRERSRREPSSPRREPLAATTPEVGSELKLVGERVEAALARLDTFLDAALQSGHERVRVVHGHGTGRLRRAVREALRRHPGVAEVAGAGPDEGGEGATIVTMRR